MPINAALKAQLDALLAERNGTTVPSGFFAWWGDTAFPSGAAGAPALTQQEWQRWYTRLQQAALSPDLLPTLPAALAPTAEFRPDGPLPIAIASFQLEVPQPAFMQRVVEAAQRGTAITPPPPALGDVIQPATAFMVAGLLHDQWGQTTPQFRSRVVTYAFDERFYFTNPGAPLPDTIEIDVNDGRGFRPATFGSRITALYPTGDAATATVRCHYGTTVREACLSVPILEVNVAPMPDETWPLTGIPSLNTGTAYVYRAPGHASVVNPVIIAEGFPGGQPYYYLYDLVNQAGTLESMRAAGYDVILLGFANGLDTIQRNAQVAIECIRTAMSTKNCGPLVVAGVSMGGLIVRFALAALEWRGYPHNTRLFFTVDTPHGGAYTNLADQWLAHYLAPASAEAATVAELLDAPSNQQFLMTWLNGGTAGVSPLRAEFLRELAGVGGYPTRPEKIAIACGRGDGVRTIPPSTPLLTWSGGPFASLQLSTLPEGSDAGVVAAGYSLLADPATPDSLSVTSAVSWEGAPGGQNVYNAIAADVVAGIGFGVAADPVPVTCAVPTLSALDIDPVTHSPFAPVPAPGSGASPFSDYFCAAENTPHLTLTPEASAWLLRKLGAPRATVAEPAPTAPSSGSGPTRRRHSPAFDPSAFDPHDPTYSSDPYPTYAQFRKCAPVSWVEPYNSYWVFRYEDAMRVFNDSDNFGPVPGPEAAPGVNDYIKHTAQATPPPGPFDALANMPDGLFFLDPPEHGRVRRLITPLFDQAMVNASTVAAIAGREELVSARQRGLIELYSQFALPMPAAVLMSVLGMPRQDWAGLGQWIGGVLAGHDITQPPGVQGLAGTCFVALNGYVQALMRGCPFHATSNSLLDLMIREAIGPDKMEAAQVQTTMANFMIAGFLSTTFLIATGTYNLLRTDQLALLRRQPALLSNAINEMLRFDAPAQLVDRFVARQRVTLGGRELIAGDPVTVVLGSANHDEAVFADADTFDITRSFDPQWPHLGFGGGIHYCIGAPLVMQHTAPVAFKTLLDELPGMRLAGTVTWQTDPYLRSVANLPLAVS